MESKYAYAMLWTDDSDDFIRHIGMESGAAGEKYRIPCNGVASFSNEWLKAELTRYQMCQ